jgi:hypothetical protein
VATTRRDSAHTDRRSRGSSGEAVGRHSMAGSPMGRREDTAHWSLLLKHQESEGVAVERRSLVQCLDEGHVRLCQGLAEAGLGCEALGEASSCHSAAHGLPHHAKHWTDRTLDKLGTNLQWGWADTAAGGAAGRRPRRGSPAEGAARRHHTLAAAVQRPARQCGRGQRLAFARRRA